MPSIAAAASGPSKWTSSSPVRSSRALPADDALAEARRIQAVLAAIERLPAKERHVLLLSAIEELNTGEMAKVLGKSESAVRALLFRARTRLRERLQKGGV